MLGGSAVWVKAWVKAVLPEEGVAGCAYLVGDVSIVHGLFGRCTVSVPLTGRVTACLPVVGHVAWRVTGQRCSSGDTAVGWAVYSTVPL